MKKFGKILLIKASGLIEKIAKKIVRVSCLQESFMVLYWNLFEPPMTAAVFEGFISFYKVRQY